MSFQNNLRKFRKLAGYATARDFAKELSISYDAYITYENKGREPRYDVLAEIAKKLHVSTDILLGLNNDDKELIKHDLSRINCKVSYLNGNAILRYQGYKCPIPITLLKEKYQKCRETAFKEYETILDRLLKETILEHFINNPNVKHDFSIEDIAQALKERNADPIQYNSLFEGLRTLVEEHYPEKAQPPATTEKLVHDELKKTNRLGRKTKQKKPCRR